MSTILCNHVTILQRRAKVRKRISAVLSTGAPIHLRKHPKRRAAAGVSLALAVPAARSRRSFRRSETKPLRRMLWANTPFLPALSAEGGPDLSMTGSVPVLRFSSVLHFEVEN